MSRRRTANANNSHGNRGIIQPCRVQFTGNTQVFFVRGLSEISQQEIDATWLTEEDTEHIQLSILKTLKRLRKGKDIDDRKYCARGLEHMRTNDLVEQRRIAKASVRNAVLSEQKRQMDSGHRDPAKIREQAIIHTKKSSDTALILGASDAAVAISIFKGSGRRSSEDGKRLASAAQGTDQNKKEDAQGSLLEEATKLVNSAEMKRSKSRVEPCSPSDDTHVQCKIDDEDDGSPRKRSSSEDCNTSRNVFSRVFSKFSKDLEGEAKSQVSKVA